MSVLPRDEFERAVREAHEDPSDAPTGAAMDAFHAAYLRACESGPTRIVSASHSEIVSDVMPSNGADPYNGRRYAMFETIAPGYAATAAMSGPAWNLAG